MRIINPVECFKISILCENNLFNLKDGNVIKEIKCLSNGILEPKTIVADPFLFVIKDTLFLFYEDKNAFSNGVISMTCTRDLMKWSEPRIVLKEQFHLSYPFVIEDDGEVYMIPETSQTRSIRLYKALNDSLTEFEFVKTLLKHKETDDVEIAYSDSSILKFNNLYFLMTSIKNKGNNELLLYVADRLKGPYTPHPISPICISNKYGRNGGSVFFHGEKLYRVAQDCEDRYGEDVHLFEITRMDRDHYEESLFRENLLKGKTKFYKNGGHHFNTVNYKDKIILATDAKEYHYYLIQRVLNKLGLYDAWRYLR